MCEAFVSISTHASDKSSVSEQDEICWICHDGSSSGQDELFRPCQCPSMVAHRTCLARWNLTQAGKVEERHCRFCHTQLPDWREAHADFPKATPVMTVVHNGTSHQVVVEQGPGGREAFQAAIRQIFNLGPEDTVMLTFGCKVPSPIPAQATELTLEGWDAFDAAVHCAAISAGQREERRRSEAASQAASNASDSTQQDGASKPGLIRRLFSRNSSS